MQWEYPRCTFPAKDGFDPEFFVHTLGRFLGGLEVRKFYLITWSNDIIVFQNNG